VNSNAISVTMRVERQSAFSRAIDKAGEYLANTTEDERNELSIRLAAMSDALKKFFVCRAYGLTCADILVMIQRDMYRELMSRRRDYYEWWCGE
jgi:hypothetical protein